ncbi:MAG TPA: site-2 protease family protein [Thermoleophilaceae bacterium]|nr:site-2 protease family protein [Thermoleophilaceae bacterium]
MAYEPQQPTETRPPELTFDDVATQQTERREHYPEGFRPEPAEPPSPLKRAGAVVAAVAVAVVKFGAKLKGLLLLLPKLKILTTSASMLVSVAAYSLIWGWQFALGFVLLLLVHEMGHVLQLKREGVPASAPLFIPFLGAVVGMKQAPEDAAVEARVGLAGPILGSLGCLVPLALYDATGNNLFRALAFTGFFLNLINLLPVLPLDGGRAMAALSPAMWVIGFVLLVGIMFVYPTPIALLVLIFGGFETYRRWKQRRHPESQRYYQVRPATRLAIAVTYIGLAAALGVGMHFTHLERTL